MKRAYSPKEVQSMNIPRFEFEGEWEAAFGKPDRTGTWIIWGHSGNGKSRFVMKLAKYLCQWCTVAYNSLEESTGLSFQKTLNQERMEEVNKRFRILDRETIEELTTRLKKRRSPDVIIIDSLQYSGLTFLSYKKLKEQFPNKLFILISHAEGDKPEGRTGKRIAYDAGVKIYVQGFRALCKGRFITTPGNHFTIWEEGASQFWNE